ncbi:MAG: polysaccharide deacetylase family protein, partial [Actinomycetota bacterium]|nr:polysaccharide deacetylase family protein [Actinomycetota bacterium]
VLRRLELPATVFLVAASVSEDPGVVDWVDGVPPGKLRTLTPDQVLEMQDQGVDFGSHSLTHRNLLSLNEEECEADLRTSRELLEGVLGRSVATLAYPGGRHDEKVRRCAQRAGFAYAFAVARDDQRAGRYGIPRAGVYRNDGVSRLKIKTSPWYLPVRTSRYWALVRDKVRRSGRSSTPRSQEP